MEKFLIAIILVPILLYSAFRDFRRAKTIEDEKYEKEKKLTPKQKVEINLKEDQKHKIFLYLALAGTLLMPILRNTFVGFFVGFGSIGLSGKIWFPLLLERWAKKQPYSKKMMLISFLVFIVSIILLATFYWKQIEYFYSDR